MKKYAMIIEYAKGSDKGCDGFRPDTKPILEALKRVANIDGEIVFYTHKKRDELYEYIRKSYYSN